MQVTDATQKTLPDAPTNDYEPRPATVRLADEFVLATLARLADAEVA